MSWRPEEWEYGNWQKDERFLRNPPTIVEERLYNAFEAGAGAMHKADIEWIRQHILITEGVFTKEDWQEFTGEYDEHTIPERL